MMMVEEEAVTIGWESVAAGGDGAGRPERRDDIFRKDRFIIFSIILAAYY